MEQEYVDPSGTAAYQGAQFFSEILCRTSGAGKDTEKAGKSQSESWVFQTDDKSSLPLSGEV